MGINTIMNSVNTLSDAVHALITNINTRNKANQNVHSKAKPVTRPVDNNIIPLGSNVSSPSHSAALNDFDIDLLNDPEPSLPLRGIILLCIKGLVHMIQMICLTELLIVLVLINQVMIMINEISPIGY